MDLVLQARDRFEGIVKHIMPETVLMVNMCRLWLQALHIDDLLTANGKIDKDVFHGHSQCQTDLIFLRQERPPEWVWKVWRQTLHKVCIVRNAANNTITYLRCAVNMIPTIPSITLPDRLDITLSLKDLGHILPLPYQKLLGEINYPLDDGKALAKAIAEGQATMYTDGTVDEGCGAHAYTIRTDTDDDAEALSGPAPMWGDPETISSLRTEHFGVLAGLLWAWLAMKKYEIDQSILEGTVDNVIVVNRINDGQETDPDSKLSIASDRDVWDETNILLQRIPLTCNFRHVKGHQDDMHKKGYHGPLSRDAHWNVHMDRKAEVAQLLHPTPSMINFGSLSAEIIHDDQPIHTKISKKIKQAFLSPPLREYIQ